MCVCVEERSADLSSNSLDPLMPSSHPRTEQSLRKKALQGFSWRAQKKNKKKTHGTSVFGVFLLQIASCSLLLYALSSFSPHSHYVTILRHMKKCSPVARQKTPQELESGIILGDTLRLSVQR